MLFKNTTTKDMDKYLIATYVVSDGEANFTDSVVIPKEQIKSFNLEMQEKYGNELVSFDVIQMQKYELK